MTACPSEDVVLAFASGAPLHRHERSAVESHLARCHTCISLIAAVTAHPTTTTPDASSVALPDFINANTFRVTGYDVGRELGRGGMGVVYEAKDLKSDKHLALKIARPDVDGAIESVRREIHSLRDKIHPGIVRFFASGIHNGLPFFAMELLSGGSLATAFAARSSVDDSSKELTTLRRISSTLAHLHSQGIVHRDLSPRNILFRQAQEPVLIDFGLVGNFPGAVGRDTLEPGGRTMGTVSYMAPEQIRGELVDARADLYSLGCLLYEALTLRAPFVGQTTKDVLRKHLHAAPAPPTELNHRIPKELEELTLRLLEKKARDRLGYAEDVEGVLSEFGAHDWPGFKSRTHRAYVYRPELVGREQWIPRFEQAIRHCQAGRGSRLLIGGTSGSGKTRLASELGTLAQRAGLSIVTGDVGALMATEQNELLNIPAAALEPLRPLLREVARRCHGNRATTDRLLGSRGPVLADYEPDLLELPGQREHAPAARLPSESERARLISYLQTTLSTLSAEQPLLVILDDLHLADELTLEFLGSLSDEFIRETSLIFVCTFRTEQVGPRLGELLANLGEKPDALEPLADSAVTLMAADMLGMSRVPATFAQFLQRQSEGNPFFVAEYVRTAAAENLLKRNSRGSWEFTAPEDAAIPALPMPTSIHLLVQRRVSALTPRAQELAEVLSVLGRTVSSSLLSASWSQKADQLDTELDELVASQVVEHAKPSGVRFLHDKIRESIYRSLLPARKTTLHAMAATAVEKVFETDVHFPTTFAELAHHWSQAGNADKAVFYWEQAGRRALETGAHHDSVAYFEAAIASAKSSGLAFDGFRACQWERGLGEAYYCIGNVEKSETHLLRCLHGLGVELPAERWSRGATFARLLLRQLIEPLSNAARTNDAKTKEVALAAGRLAFIRAWKNDALATTTAVLTAANYSDRLRDPPSCRPYSTLGLVAGLARLRPLEQRYFRRARLMAAGAGAGELSISYYMEAYLRAGEGRWAESDELAAKALSLFTDDNYPQEKETVLAVLGFSARARAHFSEAIVRADELRLSARKHQNQEHEVWSEILAASSFFKLGRPDKTLEALNRGLSILAKRSEWVCDLRATAQMAHLQLCLGDVQQATALADKALEILTFSNGPPLLISALDGVTSLANACLELLRQASGRPAAKRLEVAADALKHLSRMARVFPIAKPAHLICRGKLLTFEGKRERAAMDFVRASAMAKGLGLPFERALADFYCAQTMVGSSRDVASGQAGALFENIFCPSVPYEWTAVRGENLPMAGTKQGAPV